MTKDKSKHQPDKSATSDRGLSHTEGHRSDAKNPKKRFWRDWEPMEKFTFVIAAFTIVYSVLTGGLLLVTRNQLVVSQRAFVFASKADIFNSPHVKTSIVRPPNTPINVIVKFKNSGQTVAIKTSTTIEFLFDKAGIPSGFAFPVPHGSQPVLVAPQGEATVMKTISEQQLSDVEAGKLAFFVYGDVSYEDVFGAKHKTEYCFQFLGYSLKPEGSLDEYLFWTGPLHNCYDDNCQD